MKFKNRVFCTKIEERTVLKENPEGTTNSDQTDVMLATSHHESDITVINLGSIPPKSEIPYSTLFSSPCLVPCEFGRILVFEMFA